MSPRSVAVRAGLRRGLIELRQTLTTPMDLFGFLFTPVILLVVLSFLRTTTVSGTGLSVATLSIPGVLGTNIAYGGLMNVVQWLTVEREDGTLLRLKAVPNGMLGYLVGKVIMVVGTTVLSFAFMLIPGLLLFDGLRALTPSAWLHLTWVVVLGLAAVTPLGAVLGSLFPNPRSTAAVALPFMGLIAISGIFYPVTAMPQWVQAIAQVSPIYWLGLGMRSALLPDSAVLVEIGQSWRTLETVGVLGLWAALGLILAPVVLRRMARRESGSSMAARRARALQRIG
ncbi:MAG: ABC transporter permease [Kutzneria sp.]|nr:ABC transporter permease [Kutzneria sp.]